MGHSIHTKNFNYIYLIKQKCRRSWFDAIPPNQKSTIFIIYKQFDHGVGQQQKPSVTVSF